MTTLDSVRGSDRAPGAASYGALFSHPDEVLADNSLDPTLKRELLASWASDAHAVEHEPALRQLDSGAIVRLAEILAALRRLDSEGFDPRRAIRYVGRRKSLPRTGPRRGLRKSPDGTDDDPPPPPVAAARQIEMKAA
ncbi:hypothetical protein [Hansschlegelia sp.]|uniref:hypothetical protein n=1 Tax=Hansschlegelia sp. TaxID=2041892 RepID=UPI002C4592AE|nr:hypothetical protein [Hansschlegelia sp.]HVI27292.1 hypothetical protein [Hansschlegelia sp.]